MYGPWQRRENIHVMVTWNNVGRLFGLDFGSEFIRGKVEVLDEKMFLRLE